jgi:aminoglycoside phosphotransferase (APT) family kinase protein
MKGEDRLCVYDWELATCGIPQHDLAELLCFTWHNAMTDEDLVSLLSTYREALCMTTGEEIDPAGWQQGFRLSLRYLLISRLPLYTLMHFFRPLDYLPRVMHNWMCLYESAEGYIISHQKLTDCAGTN